MSVPISLEPDRRLPATPVVHAIGGGQRFAKADAEAMSVQGVWGDARPSLRFNGQGSQGSWLGKARSLGFSEAQSQPGPEEPLRAAHAAAADVLSR